MTVVSEVARIKVRANDLKARQDKISGSIELVVEYLDYVKELISKGDPRATRMVENQWESFVDWLSQQSDLNVAGADMLKEELEVLKHESDR